MSIVQRAWRFFPASSSSLLLKNQISSSASYSYYYCCPQQITKTQFSILSSNFMIYGLRKFSSNSNESSKTTFDNDTIEKMIKCDKVVIFMKGVPESPRCGFSNAVVQVLRMHGAPFKAHDVLESEDLRKAIKEFTSWPTIPQIFLNGEFIGGCDILLEKHQNGELIEDLKKVGIESQILKQENDNKN